MKFRMFEEHYVFDTVFGDDYKYKIINIVPSSGNRAHKHEHVENGLNAYTSNWELLATNIERRRGSDKIWLVNDEYYVHCSRSGMEQIGNTLTMSANTPEELRFTIIQHVFEGVAKQRFGAIQNEEHVNTGNITVTSPLGFIIQKELNEQEQQEYYEQIANITVDLLSKYYDCETVSDIKELVEWYNDACNTVYREYVPRKPTSIGTLFTNTDFELPSDWFYDGTIEIDENRLFIYHDDYDVMEPNGFLMIISEMSETITVEYEHDRDTKQVQRIPYDGTSTGLKNVLTHVCNTYPL